MKKKRTVIVTRDSKGYLTIWPPKANPTKDEDGDWDCCHYLIAGGDKCLIRPFNAIFGFTPRKGSKRVLKFTVDD